jgi:hypothetical protein
MGGVVISRVRTVIGEETGEVGGEGRTKVEEEQFLRVFETIVSSHDEQETPDLRRSMREPLVLSFRLDQRPDEGVCSRTDTSVSVPEINMKG